MKRILVAVDSVAPLSPCQDGLLIARQLAESGHTVETIEFREPGLAAEMPQATTHLIRWPRRICLSTIRNTRQIIARFRADEIHVWGLRTGWLTGLIASFTSVPVKRINPYSEAGRSGKWSRVRKNIVEVNRPGRMGAQGLPFFPGQRVIETSSRQMVREGLGLPADCFLAISVNPLFPAARIKDFLWGGDLLRNLRDDIWFVAAGTGPQQWRLSRYRRQLSASDRILILPDGPDTESLIAAADVYVQPSAWFSDCSALRFAMANGVPGIGITRTVHESLIRHLETGILIERGARNEIARCINRVVSHPDVAAELRANLLEGQPPGMQEIGECANELLSIGCGCNNAYTLAGAS